MRNKVLVDFDIRGREFHDPRDLEHIDGKLLEGVDIAEKDEREDEDGLHHGEARVALDFDDGVGFDVDVHDDGSIIVQYWRHETCVVCGDDISKHREKTCSSSCALELRGDDNE